LHFLKYKFVYIYSRRWPDCNKNLVLKVNTIYIDLDIDSTVDAHSCWVHLPAGWQLCKLLKTKKII